MALYAISDLHLSFADTRKRMDVFGGRWIDYENKIRDNWCETVSDTDTVVLAGDFSWAMTLEGARPDFEFVNSLPGKKIMLEGNHDFWWTSLKKMNDFCKDNSFDFTFLRCDSFRHDNAVICGSRGWYTAERDIPETNADSTAVVAREVIRLDMSLAHAEKEHAECEKIAFLHFPAVYGTYICQPIMDVLKKYDIRRCYFGHIHGVYDKQLSFKYDDIDFELIAADALNFKPCKIIY